MSEKLNYGVQLAAEIEDKGYSKKKIAEKLDITYGTLESRLVDGAFTIPQLETLQKNRYLPNE